MRRRRATSTACPSGASFQLQMSDGAVNRKLPPGFNAGATLAITLRCVASGSRNISPQQTAPSKDRSKKVESSTASQAACAAGNCRWNAAISLGCGVGAPIGTALARRL